MAGNDLKEPLERGEGPTSASGFLLQMVELLARANGGALCRVGGICREFA